MRYTDLIDCLDVVEILSENPKLKNAQILEQLEQKGYQTLTKQRLTQILVEMQRFGAIQSTIRSGYAGFVWKVTPSGLEVFEQFKNSGSRPAWREFVKAIQVYQANKSGMPITVRKVS